GPGQLEAAVAAQGLTRDEVSRPQLIAVDDVARNVHVVGIRQVVVFRHPQAAVAAVIDVEDALAGNGGLLALLPLLLLGPLLPRVLLLRRRGLRRVARGRRAARS